MEKELKNIIEILKKLMSYQTTEDKKEEINQLFNYIKSLIPKELYIAEYEFDGKQSIVISNTKEKKLDIVFCTHIDVVPAEKYECIETETTIKGRGSFDMKGSVAVCLELFKNLDTNKKVALFITSDEEITGNCAKQLLTIYDTDFAIVPDGGTDLQIVKEEKGQLQLKVSIKTKSAHASQPYNGENAILALYNSYQQLIKKYPLPISSEDYKTSINLSMIEGGEALNSVAATATMYLDIRHTSKDTNEKILKDVKSLNKDLKIEIIHAGSLFKTNLDDKNVKKYIEISKKIMKKEPEIVSSEATSDAIYFSDKKIPTILTNPKGGFAHGPKEYVEKQSLYELYKIWKEILKEDN
ncbi:MAG: M20/M25/M40 family metallo-hydrolase [Candidatus Faecimonas sp.]|nr:M20/M25/M40 family metallo-hydrolase [Mycoplasmatota bacterium]MDY2908533.1 M20/M25/M40 family metallo-hydrolase [Candidatus Faecimonas sp.]